MNDGKICVSICGKAADDVMARVDRARDIADIIEIRFDCVEPNEIRPLLEELAKRDEQFLYTYRPAEQGGERSLTRDERIQFWKLAKQYLSNDTLIDLEYDADFEVGLDGTRIISSAHFFEEKPGDFSEVYDDLLAAEGKLRKLAATVGDASDAVDLWKPLIEGGFPSVPIGMGEAGKWTRILGLANGALLTYAALDSDELTAPGQISGGDLRDVFRVKQHTPRTHIYAVLAGDTSYSLSPYMHNASFAAAELDCVFVPMQVRDLDAFMRRMVRGATREVELFFKGFSVTNPHKQAVMKFLDQIEPAAETIGAVNTIKIDSGKLHGFNTDVTGFVGPLKERLSELRNAKATVAGAGGAARACIYALQQEGVGVDLLARESDKARRLAKEFDISFQPLAAGHQSLQTDILVNATPLGTKGEQVDQAIASADELGNVKLVYDLVYNPSETVLIREAKKAGVETIGGLDMLIGQGARQFRIWTGKEAPVDVMRRAVIEKLGR